MEEEEFQEDLVSLYNLDDWQDSSSSSSSFDDLHYSYFHQPLLQETSIAGFIMANVVVSLGYDLVFFHDCESVRLVLEPRKPDDQNSAIKVLSADYLELGYLERSVATVLSPLIGNKMIHVEGMVLRSRTSCNKLVPCQFSISAKLDDLETVKTAISQGGLLLVSLLGSSFVSFHEAMVVKEKSSKGGHRGFNEKFRLVEGNEKKSGRKRFSNCEPLILHNREPEIIENQSGFFINEHSFEIEPANIKVVKPANLVEPERMKFIPIVSGGHKKVSIEGACTNGVVLPVIAVQKVKVPNSAEFLTSDPMFSSFDEFDGGDYPTNYWSETFPQILLQQANEIHRTPFKKMRLR